MDQIIIRGARTHNLKNISITLPRNQLIVITGPSGSGKSSLAFDTLYAEGQRRYVESLSAYARQFLSLMEKPDVDHIAGLSPAISIEQKSASHNPRSTVGTVTEIYDYLRVLYARIGEPRCPTHGTSLNAKTSTEMVDALLTLNPDIRYALLAPVVVDRKGEHQALLESLRGQGFLRVRIDGNIVELDTVPKLTAKQKHTIEVVVDRFKVKPDIQLRLSESVEMALRLSNGLLHVLNLDEPSLPAQVFSAQFACSICHYSFSELEPRLFSFNNPNGACPDCTGLGVKQFFTEERVVVHPEWSLSEGAIKGFSEENPYMAERLRSLAKAYDFDIHIAFIALPDAIKTLLLYGSKAAGLTPNKRSKVSSFPGVLSLYEQRFRETESHHVREELSKLIATKTCDTCHGARLRTEARNVFVQDMSLHALTNLSIHETITFFENLSLTGQRAMIAEQLNKEIVTRLRFLADVGLNYLTLARSADSLSGGEAQRIRLASQIGAGLVGVMYVLDEPSIGLHARDNERLLRTLFHLRDLGNTVIVVEHDEETMRHADHLVDIGPGAGVHGGYVIAEGTPAEVMASAESITGQYLSHKRTIEVPQKRHIFDAQKTITLEGARGHNLKNVTLTLPVGLLTCITGVSGSGKSTLLNDTLYPAIARALYENAAYEPAPYDRLIGLQHIDRMIVIDQNPIGRTPRSNPATYTGLFTPIRELFSNTQEARSRGYTPGRFSFNVRGGRCEACEGDGVIRVAMHFLPDVYVTCDSCRGKRYNRETLEILYKGQTIADILSLSVEAALEIFSAIPVIAKKLQTLMDVGLSYIALGQSATTLSGGEAQRMKLSKELAKRDTGRTLYLLDEPTTGLHFQDIERLLTVLRQLRERGNTIVVIEHNLDVIKTADWIVDLGPEGGSGGGQILVSGTPETVAECEVSHTGRFLRGLLEPGKNI